MHGVRQYPSAYDVYGDRLLMRCYKRKRGRGRLEQRIDDAVEEAQEAMRVVIAGLQALRGIAKISAVTVVSEVGRCPVLLGRDS